MQLEYEGVENHTSCRAIWGWHSPLFSSKKLREEFKDLSAGDARRQPKLHISRTIYISSLQQAVGTTLKHWQG